MPVGGATAGSVGGVTTGPDHWAGLWYRAGGAATRFLRSRQTGFSASRRRGTGTNRIRSDWRCEVGGQKFGLDFFVRFHWGTDFRIQQHLFGQGRFYCSSFLWDV